MGFQAQDEKYGALAFQRYDGVYLSYALIASHMNDTTRRRRNQTLLLLSGRAYDTVIKVHPTPTCARPAHQIIYSSALQAWWHS